MINTDRDIAINYLQQKVCPQHLTKMVVRNPFLIPGGYRRNRFGCEHCDCVIDYVGKEIKTDRVGKSLIILDRIGYPAYKPDFVDSCI